MDVLGQWCSPWHVGLSPWQSSVRGCDGGFGHGISPGCGGSVTGKLGKIYFGEGKCLEEEKREESCCCRVTWVLLLLQL